MARRMRQAYMCGVLQASFLMAAAVGCAPPEPLPVAQPASVTAVEGPVAVGYFSVCNEADPADSTALARFVAREGNVVVSAASLRPTGAVRHVRIASGVESLEYDCREFGLVSPALVVGRETEWVDRVCIPDVSTFRERGADGTVRVPFPGTAGSRQMDVLRSRHGQSVAIVGKSENGVFVSSLMLPLEQGDLVLSAMRVSIDTLRGSVESLRRLVR